MTKIEHLLNGIERSATSRQISRVTSQAVIPCPRLVGMSGPNRIEREESKVTVGHVAVLSAGKKPRHYGVHGVTVHDHYNIQCITASHVYPSSLPSLPISGHLKYSKVSKSERQVTIRQHFCILTYN